MRGTLLSLIGIFNYDDTIFDDLTLPAVADLPQGPEYVDVVVPLDKDLLVQNMLFELGELELLYTEPETLKGLIGIWSRKNKRNWAALWATELYLYNPIWNKDGKITESRQLEKTGEYAGTVSDSETGGRTLTGTLSKETTEERRGTEAETVITETESHTSGSGNRTTSHNVTGYDTNSYSPDTQDVETSSSIQTGSGSEDVDRDLTTTNNGIIRENGTSGETLSSTGSLERETAGTDSGEENETITRVERGNIGVTTTQTMIREQRDVVLQNMYDVITDSFKQKFCLMIY